MAFTTEFMYKTVCRGLFEVHRLLFSFLICTSIERDSGAIGRAEWDFLLRGALVAAAAGGGGAAGAPLSSAGTLARFPEWMSAATWGTLLALERSVPELEGLAAAVAQRPELWRDFAQVGSRAGEARACILGGIGQQEMRRDGNQIIFSPGSSHPLMHLMVLTNHFKSKPEACSALKPSYVTGRRPRHV